MSSPPITPDLRRRRQQHSEPINPAQSNSVKVHRTIDRRQLYITKQHHRNNKNLKRTHHNGALRLPDVFAKSRVLSGDNSYIDQQSRLRRAIDRFVYLFLLTKWAVMNLWLQILGTIICFLILFHASVIFSRAYENSWVSGLTPVRTKIPFRELASNSIDWTKIRFPNYPDSWIDTISWPAQPDYEIDDQLRSSDILDAPAIIMSHDDDPKYIGEFTKWDVLDESLNESNDDTKDANTLMNHLFGVPEGAKTQIQESDIDEVLASSEHVLGTQKKTQSYWDIAASSLSFSARPPYIDPTDMGFDTIERNEATFAGTIYDAKLWNPTLENKSLPTGTWWSPWVLYPGTGDANAIMQHPYQLIVTTKKKGTATMMGDKSGLTILAPLPTLAYNGTEKIGYEQANPEKVGLFVGIRQIDEYDYIDRHYVADWDSHMLEKRWSIRQVERFSDFRVDNVQTVVERELSARIVRGHPWITMRFPSDVEIIIDSLPRQLILGQYTKFQEISSLSKPPGVRPPQTCLSITTSSKWTDDAVELTLTDGSRWALIFSDPVEFECVYDDTQDRILSTRLTKPITMKIGVLDLCNHMWWPSSGSDTGYFIPADDMELCPSDTTEQKSRLRWNLFSSIKTFAQDRFEEISAQLEKELNPTLWDDIVEGMSYMELTSSSIQTFLPYFRKNPLKDELISMMENIYNGTNDLGYALPVEEQNWSKWDIYDTIRADDAPDTIIIPENFVSNDTDFWNSLADGVSQEISSYVKDRGGNVVLVGGGNGGFNSKLLDAVFGLRLYDNTGSLTYDSETMDDIERVEFMTWSAENIPPYNNQINVPPELLPDAMPKYLTSPIPNRNTGKSDTIQTTAVLYVQWPYIQYCVPNSDNRDPTGIGYCDESIVVSWYRGNGFIHWIGRQWDESADETLSDWVKVLARTIWSGVCSEYRRISEFRCDDLNRVVYFTDEALKQTEEDWSLLYNQGILDFEGNFVKDQLKLFLMGVESETTWNIGRPMNYIASANYTWKDMMLKHVLGTPIGVDVLIDYDETTRNISDEEWHDPLIYAGADSARLRYRLQSVAFPNSVDHSLSPLYYSKKNHTPMWAPERVLFMFTPLHRKLEYQDRTYIDGAGLSHTPLGHLRNDLIYDTDGHNCMASPLGNICARSFGTTHPCLYEFTAINDFKEACSDFRLYQWDAWNPNRRLFRRDVTKAKHPALSFMRKNHTMIYEKLMGTGDVSGRGVVRTAFSQSMSAIGDSYWRLVLSISPLRPGSPLHRLLTMMGYAVLLKSEVAYGLLPWEASLFAKPISSYEFLVKYLASLPYNNFAKILDLSEDNMSRVGQVFDLFKLTSGGLDLNQPLFDGTDDNHFTDFRDIVYQLLTHGQHGSSNLFDRSSYCNSTNIMNNSWDTSPTSTNFIIEFVALKHIDWVSFLSLVGGEEGLYLVPLDTSYYAEHFYRGSSHHILLNLPLTKFDTPSLDPDIPDGLLGSLSEFKNTAWLERLRWGLSADITSDYRLEPEDLLEDAEDFAVWLRSAHRYTQMALSADFSDMILPRTTVLGWITKLLDAYLGKAFENRFFYDTTFGGLVPCGCSRKENDNFCASAPRLGYLEAVQGTSSGETKDLNSWLASSCPSFNTFTSEGGLGYYQDHHKIYGHLIYLAAVAERMNPGTCDRRLRMETSTAIIDVSIHEVIVSFLLDYANPALVSDEYSHGNKGYELGKYLASFYPSARHKDWYTFNSFSNGMNLTEGLGPFGRGGAESAFAYWAIALYGSARKDHELQQWGRILLSTEIYHNNAYVQIKQWSMSYPSSVRYLGAIGTRADKGGYFISTEGIEPFLVFAEQVSPFTILSFESLEPGWLMWIVDIWEQSCKGKMVECVEGFSDLPLTLVKNMAQVDWAVLEIEFEERVVAQVKAAESAGDSQALLKPFMDDFMEKYMTFVGGNSEDAAALLLDRQVKDLLAGYTTSIVANVKCFRIGSYDCGTHTLSNSIMIAILSAIHGGAAKQLDLEDGNGRFRVY